MRNNFLELIQNTNGRIFTVTFFKRSGGLRKINCGLGVKVGLKGVGQKYNPLDKGLITVWDMQKEGYRNINLECIVSAKIDGIEYLNENLLEDIKRMI